MDLVWACDGLFPLPVEEKALSWTSDGLFHLPVDEKAVSWTWRALVMRFSFLPVKGKSVSGLPGDPPERPRGDPESGQGAPEPKNYQF